MYLVSGIPFDTKEQFVEHCRQVIGRHAFKQPIVGEDAAFVAAAFDLHPEKAEKLCGHKIVHFEKEVQREGSIWKTNCFVVVRDDGQKVPFSYFTIAKALKRVSTKAA